VEEKKIDLEVLMVLHILSPFNIERWFLLCCLSECLCMSIGMWLQKYEALQMGSKHKIAILLKITADFY
jgi:hypothetical protein